MRKILFRGKRIDNGEWVEGFIVKRPSAIQIGECSPWYISAPPMHPEDDGGFYNVAPDTVGQYTGVNDWNGKEIFEGDFIRLDGGVKRVFEITDGVVIFERGGFYVGESGPLNSLDVIAAYDGILRGEVIGNIHDNPELMEGRT